MSLQNISEAAANSAAVGGCDSIRGHGTEPRAVSRGDVALQLFFPEQRGISGQSH